MLPPIIGVLKGEIGNFSAKMGEAEAQMSHTTGAGSKAFTGLASIGKAALLGLAGSAIIGGIAAVKMAGDFQQSMTQLVTGAGESQANMGLVSKGLLDMSSQVGVSSQDLASGMYVVESAGYKGAAGLTVMRIAAEGAKVGGANMTTVANALTGALNAYHEPASMAVSITNDLVAAVGSGNMHMEDLAGSLGTVMPIAAALHVPLSQVTAAIATMTMQSVPAAVAATGLRFLMSSMANPTTAAAKEMKKFGLSTAEIGGILQKQGIQPAIQAITDAVGKKFPAGSSEYVAAVAKMVGGTRGLNTTLELSGKNAATWHANTLTIAAAANKAGGAVKGWGDTQKDFNFQLEQGKAWAGAMGIEIGMKLIPNIQKGIGFFEQHTTVAKVLAGVIGGVLGVAIGAYIVQLGISITQSTIETGKIVANTVAKIATAGATGAWTAAQWLLNVALDANPIGLVVVAIAALAGGIYLAYNHVGWFRGAVNGAWADLKGFGSWISNTFQGILNAMGGALKTAGNFLNAINPFHKASPSLVENVEAGTRQIVAHYAKMASSVKTSMQAVGGSAGPGVGSSAVGGAGGAAWSPGGGTSGSNELSQMRELLKQILTALTARGMGGTSISISGAGLSASAMASAMNRELAWNGSTR